MPTAQQLTKILNVALQKLWESPALFTKREDVITQRLTDALKTLWTDLPKGMEICHTYGRCAQADSAGHLRKEIETHIPSHRQRKHVIPDIIVHEAGKFENDWLVIEVKKSQNKHKDERQKDLETLSALVDPRGIFKYQYGLFLEISATSATAIWVVRDNNVDTIGLRSKFEKGREPTSIQLYKNVASWDYHLYGSQDGIPDAYRLLDFIATIDPSYVIIYTPELFCPVRHQLFKTWDFEEISVEQTLKCHPKTIFEQEIRPPERRRTCMLMVTHACNLNCVYCYEKFKDAAEMDFETAKQAILTEAQYVKDHRDKFDELEIDFMGGEPMMNMKLIKQVVEWLENEQPIDIPYICFATTNGTLIEEHTEWLEQHKHTFCLGVSYDGRSHHIANRGERAKKVPLKKCYEWWPFQGFHMTISKDSIKTFGEDIKYLHQTHPEYHIDAALAQGVEWNDDDVEHYKKQLKVIADYYLNPRRNQSIRPINLLMRNLGPVASQNQSEPQKKFCGSGSGMITYDTDGRTYGCHMFTPIVMGEEKAKQLKNSDFACWDMPLEDPTCATCFLKNYCPTCLGFNYHFRGNIRERDKHQCKMYLTELRATCEFQLRYFVKRPPVSPEDASILKGAIEVYPLLKRISEDSTYPFILNT